MHAGVFSYDNTPGPFFFVVQGNRYDPVVPFHMMHQAVVLDCILWPPLHA